MCLFCRNKENETRSKQIGEEIRKLCNEASTVVTLNDHGRDCRARRRSPTQPTSGEVETHVATADTPAND